MLHALTHFFAANDPCAGGSFFGIPPWYEYLVSAGRMAQNSVTKACELNGAFQFSDVVLIAMAVLDMVLRLAGLVAVVFVMYGGLQYITSNGEPDKTKDAQQTIINALIGLGIALVAIAAVSFIGHRLG